LTLTCILTHNLNNSTDSLYIVKKKTTVPLYN